MVTRTNLLARGYLPEALPPIFSSELFASYSEKANIKVPSRDVRGIDFSASQTGYRRRRFSVTHPLAQYFVADFIEKRWAEIKAFTDSSPYSLSKPEITPADGERAISITPFNELHSLLHKRLGHYPYIAKSDIRRFYPSIYTHSISWAFHGKAAAKKDRKANSKNIFFNQLDLNIRRGQDGQTIGLPIGPDTSRIVAEIIARSIDDKIKEFSETNLSECIRHVDDIYMGAKTLQEAENCIAALRKALREFELEINETKTNVYESGSFLDDLWPRQIRKLVDIKPLKPLDEAQIFEMFEEAFSIAKKEASDSPIRYLLRGADRAKIFRSTHWNVLENFLIKTLYFHPHAIDYVCLIVVWRHLNSADIELAKWKVAINERLMHHLRMGHDQEISWLLFLTIACEIKIADEVARELVQYPNAVCAIQALHARRLGLFSHTIPIDFWRTKLGPENFNSEWWLFAYEAFAKNWLGGSNIAATVTTEDAFHHMKKAGVTFYQSSATVKDLIDYKDDAPAIQIETSEYDEFDAADEDWDDAIPF